MKKKQIGYSTFEDFYSLKPSIFQQFGGTALLDVIFCGSVSKSLQLTYPDHKWLSWKFFQNVPNGFWSQKQNQRDFMDMLGKHLGYSTKEHWYKVHSKDIMQHGGSSLLYQYGSSPSKLIQAVYPDHSWLLWRFEMAPKGYWHNIDHQKDFVEQLGKSMGFKKK